MCGNTNVIPYMFSTLFKTLKTRKANFRLFKRCSSTGQIKTNTLFLFFFYKP